MNKLKLGEFGGFVKQYEKARRPYPAEVFAFLKGNLKTKKPLILDLGCGTGISTRQLVKVGTVIGCDPDPRMLAVARKHKSPKVTYVTGTASKLPFADETFDVVAAFTSLHWFTDSKSIAEIKRVLKPGGKMFAVNRTGTKAWGEGYRGAIIKAIGRSIPNFPTRNFDGAKVLKHYHFQKVRVKRWQISDLYTLKNILEYVQAISIWNAVPKPLRARALAGVKQHFVELKKRTGKIENKVRGRAVIGIKP